MKTYKTRSGIKHKIHQHTLKGYKVYSISVEGKPCIHSEGIWIFNTKEEAIDTIVRKWR